MIVQRKYLICVVSVALIIMVSLTVIANITSFQNETDKKIYVAEEYGTNIEIDGIQLNYDLPIVTINGSTYMPLRETFENCGYDVEWNAGELNSIYVNTPSALSLTCMTK